LYFDFGCLTVTRKLSVSLCRFSCTASLLGFVKRNTGKICKSNMDMAVKMGHNDRTKRFGWCYSKRCTHVGSCMLIFFADMQSVGVIPQISRYWTCAGRCLCSPVTDFAMMVEDTSYMFVTGPNVVKAVTK
jgi:propionyl-CoA carboxylase beta chain